MRDRLDLVVFLEPGVSARSRAPRAESSSAVAKRIAHAWNAQQARQRMSNAQLPAVAIDDSHGFDEAMRDLLELRARQMGLSLRRLHRAARVARTIADLEGSDAVRRDHLDEALLHRPKEMLA
jgi:magnesium chelatase family protein